MVKIEPGVPEFWIGSQGIAAELQPSALVYRALWGSGG
jgi:hypothetical protein